MATTVPPEDLRPGDLIEWMVRQITVREVRQGQPTMTGVKVYRIIREPDGELDCTLYTGDDITRIEPTPH
jgi:hypothetical protein